MEFGMEWDSIMERQYEAMRSAGSSSSSSSSPSSSSQSSSLSPASKLPFLRGGSSSKDSSQRGRYQSKEQNASSSSSFRRSCVSSSSSLALVSDVSTAVLSPVVAVSVPFGLYYLYLKHGDAMWDILRGSVGLSSSSQADYSGNITTYQGSCHCKAVEFKLRASRNIKVETCEESNYYNDVMHQYTTVKATNFEITKGKEDMNTFSVVATTTDASVTTPRRGQHHHQQQQHPRRKVGARAFCKRCGVHLIHVPDQTSPYVQVNVTCLVAPSSPSKTNSDHDISASDERTITSSNLSHDENLLVRTQLMLSKMTSEFLEQHEYINALSKTAIYAFQFLVNFVSMEATKSVDNNGDGNTDNDGGDRMRYMSSKVTPVVGATNSTNLPPPSPMTTIRTPIASSSRPNNTNTTRRTFTTNSSSTGSTRSNNNFHHSGSVHDDLSSVSSASAMDENMTPSAATSTTPNAIKVNDDTRAKLTAAQRKIVVPQQPYYIAQQ